VSTVVDLDADLGERAVQSPSRPSRRRGRWIAAALALVTVAAVVLVLALYPFAGSDANPGKAAHWVTASRAA
jgi:ferric-dicitrate binding protein FerR (iron transport regulator)